MYGPFGVFICIPPNGPDISVRSGITEKARATPSKVAGRALGVPNSHITHEWGVPSCGFVDG